jgi:hypothetical protein
MSGICSFLLINFKKIFKFSKMFLTKFLHFGPQINESLEFLGNFNIGWSYLDVPVGTRR